jgi:hypothetical protein
VRPQHDRLEKGLERLPRLDCGWLVVQPRLYLDEASLLQPASGVLRGCEVPRSIPPIASRPQRFDDGGNTTGAATLRYQLAARFKDGSQMAEKATVIGDPVEGSRGKDGIDRSCDGQRLIQIRVNKSNSVAESLEPARGFHQHAGGGVKPNSPAKRQAVKQLLSHPSRAAPGIEYPLVTPERESLEYDQSPPNVRIRDTIVGNRIPITRLP